MSFHIVVTGSCLCGDLNSLRLPLSGMQIATCKRCPLAAFRLPWEVRGSSQEEVRGSKWVELFQFQVYYSFHYFSKFFIFKN